MKVRTVSSQGVLSGAWGPSWLGGYTRARARARCQEGVCGAYRKVCEWVCKRAVEEGECVAEVECVCVCECARARAGPGECPSLHLVAPTQRTAQTRREGRPHCAAAGGGAGSARAEEGGASGGGSLEAPAALLPRTPLTPTLKVPKILKQTNNPDLFRFRSCINSTDFPKKQDRIHSYQQTLLSTV